MKLLHGLGVLLALVALSACTDSIDVNEGEHFTQYSGVKGALIEANPQLVNAEVVEFFSYACIHCKHFAPLLSQWQAEQEAEVLYVPVVFNEAGELLAKAYYLAAEQPNFSELHPQLFDLATGFSRTDSLDTQKIALIEWFNTHGIQPITSLDALDGDAYDEQIALGLLMARKFEITSTPTLVVNLQNKINNQGLTSHEELLQVAESLLGR